MASMKLAMMDFIFDVHVVDVEHEAKIGVVERSDELEGLLGRTEEVDLIAVDRLEEDPDVLGCGILQDLAEGSLSPILKSRPGQRRDGRIPAAAPH